MAELKHLIENYLKYLKNRNYTKNSIISYEINLRYFYSFCNQFNIDFKNIKGSNMLFYLDMMQDYKESTINIRLSTLKSFYEYLINMDIVSFNPVRSSLYIRKDRKKPKPLTEENESLFLDFINNKDEHIKLAFEMLLESGIRLSELKKLKEENFIEINNKYYIEVLESKNQGNRIVPINKNLYERILNYAKKNVFKGTLFSLSSRAYQYHADVFQETFNIPFSVHSLRHTYATRLSQKDIPVQVIQKLLGHKNINTTMYYVEVSDQDILKL